MIFQSFVDGFFRKFAYIPATVFGGAMGRTLRLILKTILSTALLAGGVVACNSYKSKIKSADQEPLNAASINYKFVREKVFEPHCIRCHSTSGGDKGDVNLETYDQVIANLKTIEETVFIDQSMPPAKAGGPLAAYEKSVLRMWIDVGAPLEATQPGPSPTPNGTPEPTEPLPTPSMGPEVVESTWADIYAKIIEPKCIKCHAEGEKAEDYPLTDQAYVVDPANLLITPGNPDESEIFKSVMRTDKRTMPPVKTGMTLNDVEKSAIKLWILNGAKD
jgi:uncharacterized membrane protein